jgi:ABC-type branched-subunit amino acid transport system substrate-binding protein/tetratricopeptide (TPR) repeat protein
MTRRSFSPLRLPILLLSLLFLASCVTGGGGVGGTSPRGPRAVPQSPADLALSKAESALRSGNYAGAAGLYDSFAGSFPADPRREFALSSAAKAYDLAGRYPEAVNCYLALARDYPGGGYAAEAALRLPQLHLYTGQYQAALDAALAASKAQRDPTSKASMALVEGKARFLLSDFQGAAEAFLRAAGGLPAAAADEAREGLYASFARLNQLQLNEFARRGGRAFPGPEAVWFMAFLSHGAGDQEAFLAQSQYFSTYYPSHPWAQSLKDLAASGAGPSPVPGAAFDPRSPVAGPALAAPPVPAGAGIGPLTGSHTVAALLPLSGARNSNFAAQILAGLRLAASRSNGSLGVSVHDTQGLPANAVRIIGELSSDPSVVAIVGPLNSDEALAAAQTAQHLGMPLIAVSTRIGLATSRPYVFRVFLTYEAQARAVARYAVSDKGHSLLGVLYPDDLYGTNMLKYFESEALRLGAQVTAKVSYASPNGNYAEAANSLTGGKGARRVSTSYQAETGFSSLYIPEAPSVVTQILPFLAFNDVTKMEFLGTSLWAAPEFPKAAGRYLEGCVIPVAFTPLSERQEARAFLDAYRAMTGQDPDQFAVYGYDAGLAVLSALSASPSGGADRVAFRQALASLPPVPGASGPFVFDPEGEFQVSPLLLTVGGGEFRLLREASAP